MAAGAFRAEGRGNLSSPDLPLGGQLDFAIKGGGVDGGAERVSTAGSMTDRSLLAPRLYLLFTQHRKNTMRITDR